MVIAVVKSEELSLTKGWGHGVLSSVFDMDPTQCNKDIKGTELLVELKGNGRKIVIVRFYDPLR